LSGLCQCLELPGVCMVEVYLEISSSEVTWLYVYGGILSGI
jgi:hypothetical protein